jgi:redox-sensitive bicupin YhaK (pirin superfamily)
MVQVRKSNERGQVDHGWLKTFHTFSFNTYHDENFMGFRSLRVINEDWVRPGKGFGTHPHHDMEIITYVVAGALEHKDSMGNGSIIRPGDVQRMSAGTGVMHSEYNPSHEEPVHLLQIWILPDNKGVEPSYEQKTFLPDEKLNRMRLIASRNGREDSVTIHQDANVFVSILEKEAEITLPVDFDRHFWLQMVRGKIKAGENILEAGDGAAISEETAMAIIGMEESEFIVFDLA